MRSGRVSVFHDRMEGTVNGTRSIAVSGIPCCEGAEYYDYAVVQLRTWRGRVRCTMSTTRGARLRQMQGDPTKINVALAVPPASVKFCDWHDRFAAAMSIIK